MPDFVPETANIRSSEVKIAAQTADMLDRRVEITGPTDRKMVINALNCGAPVFMADFEDADTPTWHNMIDGQINLRDAVRRTITLDQEGKKYKLNDKTAVLMAWTRRGVRLVQRARSDAAKFAEPGEPAAAPSISRTESASYTNTRANQDRSPGARFSRADRDRARHPVAMPARCHERPRS